MRHRGTYSDPTTIAYVCRGCEDTVASPISFACQWHVVATNWKGRQILLTETRKGDILCPKCGARNNQAYPRKTTDLFWHDHN